MSNFDRNPSAAWLRVSPPMSMLSTTFSPLASSHDQRLLLLVVMAGLLFKIDTRLALATSPFSRHPHCHHDFRKFVREPSPHPHGYCAHQRFSPGIHFRHERRAALQSRTQAMDEFETHRDNMLAWRDAISLTLFLSAVEFLSFTTIAAHFWSGGIRILSGASLLAFSRRLPCFAQRFFRPIQDSARNSTSSNPPWPLPSASSKLLDEPVLVDSDPNAIPLDHPLGEIESETSGSAIATCPTSSPTKIGYCAMSLFEWNQGRPSPS